MKALVSTILCVGNLVQFSLNIKILNATTPVKLFFFFFFFIGASKL
jgi:hypothetical protein